MKKDNGRSSKHKNISGQTLPVIDNNSFNQTIIINNPKININYIDQINNIKGMNGTTAQFRKQHTTKQHQNSRQEEMVRPEELSKGFDAWNLNKNLKEFSETRQLGFFKNNGNRSKNTQCSPYLVHKTKTQDLKPIHKISPSPFSQKIYDPSLRGHHRTISTTRREAIQALEQQHQRSSSIKNNPTKTISIPNPKPKNKKYESNTSKNQKSAKHILSQRQIIPIQQTHLKKGVSERVRNDRNKYGSTVTTMIINQTTKLRLKNLESKQNNLKKSIQQDSNDMNYEEYDEFLNTKSVRHTHQPLKNIKSEQNYHQQFQNQSEQDSDNQQSSLINQSPLLAPRRKPKTQDQILNKASNIAHHKVKYNRRAYQHSIDKISDCFLKKIDNYFDHVDTCDVPSSKIQLYASTINQPHIFYSQKQIEPQKVSPLQKVYQGYDFQFEEQKTKKRPKTPFKRKKMYEPAN